MLAEPKDYNQDSSNSTSPNQDFLGIIVPCVRQGEIKHICKIVEK